MKRSEIAESVAAEFGIQNRGFASMFQQVLGDSNPEIPPELIEEERQRWRDMIREVTTNQERKRQCVGTYLRWLKKQ